MTDDEKAALADVYERAAEYLEEYGWQQGASGTQGQARCFIGATYSAVYTNTTCDDDISWRNADNLWRQANNFAAKTLRIGDEWKILYWNDDPARTKDEVINVLHGLANKLR